MSKNEMYMKIRRLGMPKQTAKSYLGMMRNMTDQEAELFVEKVCRLWERKTKTSM